MRIVITASISEEEYAAFEDAEDLRSSLAARLSEVYDRNGNPVTLHKIGVRVPAVVATFDAGGHLHIEGRP